MAGKSLNLYALLFFFQAGETTFDPLLSTTKLRSGEQHARTMSTTPATSLRGPT